MTIIVKFDIKQNHLILLMFCNNQGFSPMITEQKDIINIQEDQHRLKLINEDRGITILDKSKQIIQDKRKFTINEIFLDINETF